MKQTLSWKVSPDMKTMLLGARELSEDYLSLVVAYKVLPSGEGIEWSAHFTTSNGTMVAELDPLITTSIKPDEAAQLTLTNIFPVRFGVS